MVPLTGCLSWSLFPCVYTVSLKLACWLGVYPTTPSSSTQEALEVHRSSRVRGHSSMISGCVVEFVCDTMIFYAKFVW
jgi:hypothetical protein